MADEDEAPQCRICFDGAETPSDPLFRPCLCKGTSAYVHVSCLDTWRCTSANPRSFYECEQCKFKYRFGTGMMGDQLALARLLATAGAVHALALLALLSLIFFAGFVGKAFDASLEWHDVWRCFNARHVLTGVTTTGLGSIIGWATSLGGLGGGNGWRFIVGDAVHIDNRADNLVGTIIGAAAVLAGLCMAFSWIYGRLEQWARVTTRHAQHIVLDVQGGRAPSAERRAASAAAPGADAAGGSAAAQRQRPRPRAAPAHYEPID